MRITNSMMIGGFLKSINTNMKKLDKYQYQLYTGRRLQNLSDDPIGIMSILDTRSKLKKLDNHNSSIGDAKSWLSQTESSLDQLNKVLSELYEKAVGAANGTMTGEDKKTSEELVKQLRQQIVQVGNSTYGSRYIFGGFNTTQPPFAYDLTGTLQYNGVDLITAPALTTDALKAQVIQYATGTNLTTDVSLNGVELMGTGANNLDKILADFQNALETDASPDTLGQFVSLLQNKQQDVLSLLADVGGRVKRLEMMEDSNASDEINYTEVLSNVEDVDQAEATMNFKMAEAVYRSALAVGAQVIQPTLLDFLK